MTPPAQSHAVKPPAAARHRGDWQDCWTTHYRLGVLLNRRMPFNHTLLEVARHFGISKQAAYVESVVALGKLVFRLRRRFPQLFAELTK